MPVRSCLSQMLAGAIICVFSLRYIQDGQPCHVDHGYAYAGAAMYAVYFFLFAQVGNAPHKTKIPLSGPSS